MPSAPLFVSFTMNKQVMWIVFIVSGMLITGTINTIVKKIQNGWMAPGIIGRMHKVCSYLEKSFVPSLRRPYEH